MSQSQKENGDALLELEVEEQKPQPNTTPTAQPSVEAAISRQIAKEVQHVEDVRTPEQQKLINKLMKQRQAGISIWTKRGLQLPFTETAIMDKAAIWIQGLPIKVVQGFLTVCPKSAEFVTVPAKISALDTVEIMNKGKEGGINPDYIITGGASSYGKANTDEWKFAITNGARTIRANKNIWDECCEIWNNEREERARGYRPSFDHNQVVAYRRHFEEQGLGIMPEYGYLPIQMKKIDAGKQMIDQHSWTAFGCSEKEDYIRAAFVYMSTIWLSWNSLNIIESENLRCRPWFEGNIE